MDNYKKLLFIAVVPIIFGMIFLAETSAQVPGVQASNETDVVIGGKITLSVGQKVTISGINYELILDDVDDSGAVVFRVENEKGKLYPGASLTFFAKLKVYVVESSYSKQSAVFNIVYASPPTGDTPSIEIDDDDIYPVPPVVAAPPIKGSFIITTNEGECPEEYITSKDGEKCIKPSTFGVPAGSPTVTGSGVSGVSSTNGECPEKYVLSEDGEKCLKPLPPIPTIVIKPGEIFTDVLVSSREITIKDKDSGEEATFDPQAGFSAIVSSETLNSQGGIEVRSITIQTKPGYSNTTISAGESSVETSESIQVKNNKVLLREKEIKVMPDVASDVAISKLGDIGFKIELKDVGNSDDAKPAYVAEAITRVKIFGLFGANMTVKTEVDAQTGATSEIKKPWWSFLAS